jgi:tetratricopeptide (TPR) repeat protein
MLSGIKQPNAFYMETYYTIEEKYLQVLDELNYGERPKALKLLNEIIANDATYARAHYQLGLMYYYSIEDYQLAGYHFKLCAELEPDFPEVYEHYLRLVIFLGMDKMVNTVAEKALAVKGVNTAVINSLLGLFAEKKKDWARSITYYHSALLDATNKDEQDNAEADIKRIREKLRVNVKYNYLMA